MWYVPLLLHVVLIWIARRIWRQRGLEWSAFDTANCVIMPVVLLLAWPFVASLIPSGWVPSEKTKSDLAGFMIVFLPPLLLFWSWFFWSGLRRKRHP